MTILTIKHKIEHKSIKAQTQKYSIKKEQNRTHEKNTKIIEFEFHGERGARAYNGSPGSRAPGGGSQGKPPEAEWLFVFRVRRKLQIFRIIDICKSQ